MFKKNILTIMLVAVFTISLGAYVLSDKATFLTFKSNGGVIK